MRFLSSFMIAICLAVDLPAHTCEEPSQRDAFRRAVAVFRGIVVEVQMVNHESYEPMLVTFKVDRAWKGPATETMRVFALGSLGGGVGYPFRQGERYVVYTTKLDSLEDSEELRLVSGGGLVYGIGFWCRLRVRTDVDEESRKLGRGRPPLPDSPKQ